MSKSIGIALSQIVIAAIMLAAGVASADEKPAPNDKNQTTLEASDRKLLERLPKEFVFDPPADAVLVAEPVMMRNAWGSQQMVVRHGWRVPGKKDEPDRVYFCDGDSVSLPKAIALPRLDFVELCRKRYEAKPKPRAPGGPDDETFRRMRRNSIGDYDTPALIDAVWLHKLGHDDLAIVALEHAEEQVGKTSDRPGGAEQPADPQTRMVNGVKRQLATIAFLEMVHAFMVRADDEALRHGQRLLKLYPDEAKQVGQVAEVMGDLERRKKSGTFGKPAPPMPNGFDSWDNPKKIAWLIDSLDEVDEVQMSQPGDVPLALNPRVSTLIAIGDPAVPALIDTIERDGRLTRSVHFWRDFSSQREVLGVREAALTAVMSILKLQAFEARSTGDNFTAHGEAEAKRVAARLRQYWKEYGGLAMDARMMKVLADPKSRPQATREAAANLAGLGKQGQRYLSTSGATITVGPESRKPNPAINKFSKPTTAEAILGAMDRDLAAHEAKRGDQLFQYEQNRIEDAYLIPLTELGDKRIAPNWRADIRPPTACVSAANLRRRRTNWATRAHLRNSSTTSRAAKSRFRRTTIRTETKHDQPATVELRGIISSLVDSHLPEADAALFALADPKNPFHGWVAGQIHEQNGFEPNPCRRHPFCLAFLRRELDDTHPSGVTYQIKGDQYERKGKNFSIGASIPDYLSDPSKRHNLAEGRVCDDAAADISEMTLGVPVANPLFLDADQRLNQMKQALDRFHKRFHVASRAESMGLEQPPWQESVLFVPTIDPLDHPATADDVAKGRAIFELGGRGKLAPQKLPAAATLAGAEKHSPRKVLIFQAESDAEGKVTYGIVGVGILRGNRRRACGDQTVAIDGGDAGSSCRKTIPWPLIRGLSHGTHKMGHVGKGMGQSQAVDDDGNRRLGQAARSRSRSRATRGNSST